MARFAHLSRRLRIPLRKFHGAFDPVAAEFGEIQAALQGLDAAMNRFLPLRRSDPLPLARGSSLLPLAREARRRRYAADPNAEVVSLRQQRSRLRAKVWNLQQELDRMRAPKDACPVPMLTTVALSFPPTNARAFARSLRDLLPKGQSDWLYRKRIDAIRDAFVHVAQEKVADHAASKIAAAARAQLPAAPGAQGSSSVAGAAGAQLPAAVGAQGPEHTSVAFLHIHDESIVRLRSFSSAEVAGMYGPVRSRSSSVQVHVCSLWATPTEGHPLLVELDALHNKTAGTLATSLDGVVRLAVSTVRKAWRQPLRLPGRCGLCTCLSGTVSRRTPQRRASCWRLTCSPLWRRASVTSCYQ